MRDDLLAVGPYVALLRAPDVLQLPSEALQHILIEPPTFTLDPFPVVDLQLYLDKELALGFPGLDAVMLVVGATTEDAPVAVHFAAQPIPTVTVSTDLSLRLSRDLLKPVQAVNGQPGKFESDPTQSSVEIAFGTVTFSVNIDGDVNLTGTGAIDLPPCMIGDSGVVIQAHGVSLYLDGTMPPPGKPSGWKGVHVVSAHLYLPGELGSSIGSLSLTDGYIGNGGFSGTVASDWSPAVAAQLGGISVSLSHASLTFVQNALTNSSIRGTLQLPFFDEPVNVDLGLGIDGGFHIRLDSTTSNGLYKLTKEDILEIELDSLAFEIKDGLFTTKVSGKLKPLFGGLKWPEFDVKELSIDSKGHVQFKGGWLDLPKQYALDFHGFKLEITKLGFGNTDDGGKWIGFSGALKLVEGLQAGASVEGLRVTWYEDGRDPKVTFNGIGVKFAIPGVLSFEGAVSFRELEDPTTHEKIRRFDGKVKLKLETPKLEIDGVVVIGSATGLQGKFNFFAIYLQAKLPTGILLGNTGLSLYEIDGLFALRMEPNKTPEEAWYSLDHSKSWYHRSTRGVTDLLNKWQPRSGSLALGAGATIGTSADDGYLFNGNFLLALVFPGPIALLQGSSDLLKKRGGEAEDATFRSLAVFDGREHSVTVGIEAEYKKAAKGELIEIAAGTQAFFSFDDPGAWYLHVGEREPRDRRVRALFARFVEANAYFMLDAHQLALGAWFGYDRHWKVGPLSIGLEAWAEGNVLISFKPSQFEGDLWLHGSVDLKVFKFGLGLTVDARIAAEVFTPFHLVGEFSVKIRLPFNVKFGATLKLEWGIVPDPPPLPLPLHDVAIEHLKTTGVNWPLPRKTLLLPDYDDGGGFLGPAQGGILPSVPVPVVPLDARPHLTFGRQVHDAAEIGVNGQVPPDWETIGDPSRGGSQARARYTLQHLRLAREAVGGGWQVVASDPKSRVKPYLYGSWAALPPMPGSDPGVSAQTRLWLWNLNPFAFVRRSGSEWEEWFAQASSGYPCIPLLKSREVCFGFESLAPGPVSSPWTQPEPPAFTLSWSFGPATVRTINRPTGGAARTVKVLCFSERAAQSGVRVRPAEPGRAFRIVLAQEPALQVIFTVDDASRVCVDFREKPAGTLANPWTDQRVRFEVRGEDGELLPQGRVQRWGGGSPLGLNAGFRLDVFLPCAASWVELIVSHRPPFQVLAFDPGGTLVATHAPGGPGAGGPETIRLEGKGIARLEIHAAGNEKLLHRLCFACPLATGPTASGVGPNGEIFGPFFPVDGIIEVEGQDLDGLVVQSPVPFCLEGICVTPDPEAGRPVRREERIQHIQEELARWSDEAPVLAPDTSYRLEIETRAELEVPGRSPVTRDLTEYAYFRTEGPPGLATLSVPVGTPEGTFQSGLDDLTRYVRQTTPPTVPAAGEKAVLYKPFYGAYDLKVEFNEAYVETMYRLDRRDLGLYLYDNNRQPARDFQGRLLAPGNAWGKAETLTLSERDQHWVTLIDGATCLEKKLDPKTFARESILDSAEPGRVLAPDTLYSARLVPLLLHETFPGSFLGHVPDGWYVEDGGPGGSSNWKLGEVGEPPSRFVEQASAIGGVDSPARPGTLLLLAGAGAWTDYRVSVYVRAAAGAVGVVVRHDGPGTGYRFSLDGRVRRLIKGSAAQLAEDHFSYRKDRDHLVTLEAIGKSLRAYVDGEPVFAVEDGDFAAGGVGLYACQSPGARFADVRVDDLRFQAPGVYQFEFTTSLYANFFHHLHSYQDETWRAVDDLGEEAGRLGAAVPLSSSPPTQEEARAYDALAGKALGKAPALQNPARVEVTRLESAGAPVGFLVRSPEPFAWDRLELSLSGTPRHLPASDLPGAVKLTDATFGIVLPAEESVGLLLREATDLSGYRVELRSLPGALAEPAGDPMLLVERFAGDPAATRARFTMVDSGTVGGPSDWRVEGGALIQIAEIGGGAEPELPGTVALAGDDSLGGWTDYRFTADLRCDSGGALGVVFRWVDADNHYRLSLDAGRKVRRLIKSEKGQVSILWEDAKGYAAGEPFRLTVEAVGSRLTGFLGGDRLFQVTDAAQAAGRVGLYCADNGDARFEAIEVRRPSLDAQALARDSFATGDLAGWGRIDETPGTQPSTWETSGGELHLSSFVEQPDAPFLPGTYAYTGDPGWTDAVYSTRLRCQTGADIGLIFRGRDLANYYRFSMNSRQAYRRLVKRVNGVTTVLWEDGVPYPPGQWIEVTVVAVGSSLRGYLDGVPLFAVEDGDVLAGRIGLYARGNADAHFSQVRVFPAALAFDGWQLDEPFDELVPDRWSFFDALTQPLPDGWAVDAGALRPAGADPSAPRLALTGDPAESDCRLALRVRPGVDGGLVGAAFRHLDGDNTLLFFLDAGSGDQRLVKRFKGQETVLWQGKGSATAGREIGLTFDAVGERLAGWLDGEELFRLDAADLPAGQVGFFTAGSPDARFTEVRVSLPEWTTWYGFGGEDRLPAGTRVRVQAGAASSAATEAGLERRSASPLGETGRLRFPSGGAELRVVSPDGPGHRRSFVTPEEHVALADPKVIRRADGTGFVLLPFGGSPLIEGQYRLDLTWHRERSGAVHPFSQAGDRAPERAVIDIPWKAR